MTSPMRPRKITRTTQSVALSIPRAFASFDTQIAKAMAIASPTRQRTIKKPHPPHAAQLAAGSLLLFWASKSWLTIRSESTARNLYVFDIDVVSSDHDAVKSQPHEFTQQIDGSYFETYSTYTGAAWQAK